MKDISDQIIKGVSIIIIFFLFSCSSSKLRLESKSPNGKYVAKIIGVSGLTSYDEQVRISESNSNGPGDLVFGTYGSQMSLEWSEDSTVIYVFYTLESDLNKFSVKKKKWKDVNIIWSLKR